MNDVIMGALVENGVDFVTTVPCKQLAGVIEEIEQQASDIYHIPANREDEGMGLCAGAHLGGKRPAIIMQNTAIGVTINSLATLIQYYRMPLPMLISYRGEVGEPVACQVEMAVHTKALLNQLNIPTYHFYKSEDANELSAILSYCYMSKACCCSDGCNVFGRELKEMIRSDVLKTLIPN